MVDFGHRPPRPLQIQLFHRRRVYISNVNPSSSSPASRASRSRRRFHSGAGHGQCRRQKARRGSLDPLFQGPAGACQYCNGLRDAIGCLSFIGAGLREVSRDNRLTGRNLQWTREDFRGTIPGYIGTALCLV
jgi:hypothetical protein